MDTYRFKVADRDDYLEVRGSLVTRGADPQRPVEVIYTEHGLLGVYEQNAFVYHSLADDRDGLRALRGFLSKAEYDAAMAKLPELRAQRSTL